MKNKIQLGVGYSLICFLFSLLLSGPSCFSPPGTPHGQLIRHSDCKSFLAVQGSTVTLSHSSSEECLEYIYDGQGHLSLKHINAGFNCCPGTISADIVILAGEIIIKEKEASSLCDCNCLFDLDHEFVNIKPSLPDFSQRALSTARRASAGIRCVPERPGLGNVLRPRKKYPWGL